ncbi:MAG TPA: enoyl-CoA hydratase/isomerase family protein [Sphingobacteriaceae bacterium]
MNTIQTSVKDRAATITLNRGRSNAMNAEMVIELQDMFRNIRQDDAIHGVILTGNEGFFSAGLDLIELYDYNEQQIGEFWKSFLQLVHDVASFKKPLVSAISGHSPAGGCVLALCSDYRIMAEGKFIIGLNEVPVGLIVPDSIFHLYAFWLGQARAYQYLLEGRLMNPEEARQVGLVDELIRPVSLQTAADRCLRKYLQYDTTTWQQSKVNLRRELVEKLSRDQSETLNHMLKQWWSPSTRSILQTIINNLKQKT